MFKQLILISMVASVSACSSLNEARQCDPEKNYVFSNPEAIEEYKKLKLEGYVKSIYYKDIPITKCNWDHCIYFDNKKLNFIEKNFDDENRKGIYKIYATENSSGKDCFKHNELYKGIKDICFYALKNDGDRVFSDYTFENNEENGVYKSSLYDNKNNLFLFKVSSQMYSTHALIGTSSSGYCKYINNNNPDYKFKISSLLN